MRILVLIGLLLLTNGSSYQIQPEKPTELSIRTCTHSFQPKMEETMMFFPDEFNFCLSVNTTKTAPSLLQDTSRTTFLQSTVSTILHEVGSPYRCHINFMGYGGEYRLAPDLGYYPHCQKSLSQYTNELLNENSKDLPAWNISNPHCPIQALPNSYRNFVSCDLEEGRWYELIFTSSIHYEVHREDKFYHQLWANYSTAYFFKPERYLKRSGGELYWLQRLVELKVKHCFVKNQAEKPVQDSKDSEKN